MSPLGCLAYTFIALVVGSFVVKFLITKDWNSLLILIGILLVLLLFTEREG